MFITNRDPRTSNTRDMSASVRSGGRACVVTGILNLCEGGMLVRFAGKLAVGETAHVELSGPAFRYAGRARVAHCDGVVMGLRFLSWQGPVERRVHVLVENRLRASQIGFEELDACALDRLTMWADVEHDHTVLGQLANSR